MKLSHLAKRFRVDNPRKFSLSDIDPADTGGLDVGKVDGEAILADGTKRLSELQERLYAQDQWAVLVIFQGMDAAGKDGAIKHIMSGVNPQGCEVTPFKAPSAHEIDHDFLWRSVLALPERGRIGIFNRSYYEETLVVRVHDELLQKEKLPKRVITKDIWKHRFKDIRAFERYLARNGTLILKFHLRLSKEEQARRFLERLDEPAKRWKFSMGDVVERKRWNEYMDAYDDMIRHTSTEQAPWYVVPADNKWFARVVIAEAMIDALSKLDLNFPRVAGPALNEMRKMRRAFLADIAPRKRRRKH